MEDWWQPLVSVIVGAGLTGAAGFIADRHRTRREDRRRREDQKREDTVRAESTAHERKLRDQARDAEAARRVLSSIMELQDILRETVRADFDRERVLYAAIRLESLALGSAKVRRRVSDAVNVMTFATTVFHPSQHDAIRFLAVETIRDALGAVIRGEKLPPRSERFARVAGEVDDHLDVRKRDEEEAVDG